ncbi:hypothetical protein [Mesorhizobium sp. M0276]|uniref:hypothetical protein n=1 Tax=Mesorhizobium sp. M0276 TaxID=2956928 RepID=UPI00333C4B24
MKMLQNMKTPPACLRRTGLETNEPGYRAGLRRRAISLPLRTAQGRRRLVLMSEKTNMPSRWGMKRGAVKADAQSVMSHVMDSLQVSR